MFLNKTITVVVEILFYICRAYVEWYFRYYDLPYKYDLEDLLHEVPKENK